MEKVLVIADNFRIIHSGHLKLLEEIQAKMNEFGISKTYILISQEPGDILGFLEKEALFQKLIAYNPIFEIASVPCLKISKELKQIALNREDVLAVFTTPFQKDYVENGLIGIPTEIREFYTDIDVDLLEEAIMTGNYQAYCNMMPEKLWDEFQNLKEIYTMDKLTENFINFKEFLKIKER